jgi:dCTP deaminase
MLINDSEIKSLCEQNHMIVPHLPQLMRSATKSAATEPNTKISFGQSSYGYDLRLSPEQFFVYPASESGANLPAIDPKRFDQSMLRSLNLEYDETEDESFFVLPARQYGLGVTLEQVKMPRNVSAIAIGKSTYARAGLILNCTPIEAGWCGHITLEMFNPTSLPLRIYAYEGIVQLLFFRGNPCEVSYADRQGKYQNQPHTVVLPKL